jgi:simple sugar transport system permease protein
MDLDGLLSLMGACLRTSAPLLAVCLAGLWSERAGIVNVALEGKLLASAFAAAAVATLSGSAALGIVAAVAAAIALALLPGFMSMNRHASQIVSGMAINLIAAGATSLAGSALFGEGGRTPSLETASRLMPLPGIGLSIVALAAFLAVPLTAFALRQTRFGLCVCAAGENPQALAAAGGHVRRTRFGALVICGVLAGLAGAELSLSQAAAFLPGMSAGKGFMALAALVLASWQPFRALGACLLFGCLDAIAVRFQGIAMFGGPPLPVQLMQALPYILTLVLLAGFVGRARSPAAAGVPYEAGR